MTFGARLKKHRGGLTQVQAASAVGCPIGTYRDWEQDRRTPPGWLQEKVLAEAWDAKIAHDAASGKLGRAEKRLKRGAK